MEDLTPVSFNEEALPTQFAGTQQKSFLVRLAYATGLAKTDDEAAYVLLGAAVLIIVLAIALYFLLQPHSSLPAQTPNSPSWPRPISPAAS